MTKTPTTYCYVTDHLGSVRTTYRVTGENEAVPLQHISYMPSGAVIKDSHPSLQKMKFTGKELVTMHGWNMYDSGARFQYRVMPRFSSIDPMCEKYYSISPYAYCVNNPVRFIDPDGCDTLNISFNQGKWLFNVPIIAKGNDVFNVTVDGVTSAYTFSEGDWGERVDALNLEVTSCYTL